MPDHPNQLTLKDFKKGQRVQLAPHTDLWMRGIRYGEILYITRTRLTLKGDNGRSYVVPFSFIGEIVT